MARLIPSFVLIVVAAFAATGQTTIVEGTLLGTDGRPMRAAHVGVSGTDGEAGSVDADGRFQLELHREGMVLIEYSGAEHESHRVAILVEERGRRVGVDVRLAPRDETRESGTLTPGADAEVATARMPAKPESDTGGNLRARGTLQSGTREIRFQAAGLIPQESAGRSDGTVCFHQSDGVWTTVRPAVGGGTTVVFAPRLVPSTNDRATVMYREGFQRETVKLLERMEGHRDAFPWEDRSDRTDDHAREVRLRTDRITWAIASTRDVSVQRLHYFEYLMLITQSGSPVDTPYIRNALDVITPQSHVWEIDPLVLLNAVSRIGSPIEPGGYIDRFLASSGDPMVRAQIAYSLARMTRSNGDTAALGRYMTLLNGQLRSTPYAQHAATEFAPDRRIRAGLPAPDFHCTAVENSTSIHSRKSLLGKLYLIDFWATWCVPCIAEMLVLHDAYRKFHGRGFQILSISLDARPELVTQFRQGKWSMPWLNGFVQNGLNSDIARAFEVVGIPKAILVDEDGIIIATEGLRGAELEQTLARHYGPDGQR